MYSSITVVLTLWATTSSSITADRAPTPLLCPSGDAALIVAPTVQPAALETLPFGTVGPSGWLLDQLLLQANGLAGYLSDSSFPGADHVNTSLWVGGDGKKGGGATQWLPYWTNGQVPLTGLLLAANAQSRVDSGTMEATVAIMEYVLAHTNRTNGWIGPYTNEPGDANGHGLWDPLNMLRSLFAYAEFTPAAEAAVAAAAVAHLTAEYVEERREGGGRE